MNAGASSENWNLVPAQPHSAEVRDLLGILDVAAGSGLEDVQAAERLRRFGPNTIVVRKPVSALALVFNQIRSPVVWLLSAAAALAFYFGETVEGAAIGVVLAINTMIGFFTEMRAVRSIEALRALGRRFARVRRGGQVRTIPAEELVPGDIVLVEGGDAISADLRIVEASHLGADESTLTGESMPVDKDAGPVAQSARITERTCMLFKGTMAVRGSAVGVVVGTGQNTELGRISRLVEEAESERSPLERRLARLSGQLVRIVAVLTVAVAALGMWTGQEALLMVEAAIALAVAAVPEGLPIVATLALARGMWRMARQNALVERLSAVETLGATTVILTDKTGTLTENRMTVRRLSVASGEKEIDGSPRVSGDPLATRLLEVAVMCNDAALGEKGTADSGDPMEIALLQAGEAADVRQHDLAESRPAVRKHAFETAHRMMATVHGDAGRYFFAVKGAPEAVLNACSRVLTETGEAPMDEAMRRQWAGRAEELAQQGLRVLAGAGKTEAEVQAPPYGGLTFLGLLGLEDPARSDVPGAIRDCRAAGIEVVMVTGDHAATAQSIGRAVGLGERAARIAEGPEIEQLVDGPHEELRQIGIFARVSPAEKIALVRAYQKAGDIVAMTGDGVNDAPALKQADIGVAMGLRGTDVAREAAAMVLLDDAFPTIVKAIREGRVIFGNIRRFAAYLLSCNLTEVLVVGVAIAATLPLPILPLQILYLNLVTDVFPAFALAMGDGERDILRRPPRSPKEEILGRRQWITITLHSLVMTAAAFSALGLTHLAGLDGRATVTTTFLTVAFAQLWHVFNMRGTGSRLFVNEVTRNPWVWAALALCIVLLALPPYWPPAAEVLHLEPPTAAMWAIVMASSLSSLLLIQAAMIGLDMARRWRAKAQ
jgi:Ca2+-transporting ATPase